MFSRGPELKARAEKAQAAYEGGVAKLYRADGSRKNSDSEHAGRVALLSVSLATI